MKVLYLPIGSQPGTEKAFKKFAETYVFDFLASKTPDQDLIDIVSRFKPDWIHMQLQMTGAIQPKTLKLIKEKNPSIKISNWTGDIRQQPSKYFINISKNIDVSLLSSTGQIELYKLNGCINPVYWQIGYDPDSFKPLYNKEFKYDVSFLGNNYGKTFPDGMLRVKIVKALKQKYGIRAGIFGTGYPGNLKIGSCVPSQANEIYNNSVCALSVSNFNDVNHYFSDRFLMCLASGRPTITYRFPGVSSYFVDRGDILVAQSPDHVLQLVDECIQNQEFANKIGKNGHLKVLAEHSFESKILELFHIIGGL